MNDTPSLADTPRWKNSYAGLVVGLSFLSYLWVVLFAQWIWDDPDYVWRNPVLIEEGGLGKIWLDTSATPQYYPVVHSSFWLEYQLVDPEVDYSVDLDATLFHFNNVLIFAITALLFWKVLIRLRIPGALVAVLLFAVHPVNVESVAWVTERKNMLSGMFALLTVLAFLRFLHIGGEDDDGKPKDKPTAEALNWRAMGWGFAFWGLGLLSKSVIAFVPPALFLVVWWKRPKDLFRSEVLVALLLLLIPGVAAGLHTAWLEKHQVGAGDVFFPEYDHFGDRLMLAGTVVWVYLKHVLLPIEQMFFYPKWDPEMSSWWQWLLLLGAIALPLTLLWKSKQWGRGPLVAVLIFGGALFPVMGFTNVYPMRFSWVADHFQYHANFAMFALLGAVLVKLPIPRKPGQIALGAVLAVFVGLSNLHGKAFESAEVLWRTTIASNPACWIAYENLGVEVNKRAIAARESGDEAGARALEQEAMNLFYEALKLDRDPHLLQSTANNHLGWFTRYRNPNDLDRAEELLVEALADWEDRGSLHKLMGDVKLARGDYAAAYASFSRALTLLKEEKFQAEFLEKKLLSPTGASIAFNWSVALFAYGRELLAEGKGAEALALWSEPRQPYGPPNFTPMAELYHWGAPSRWFDVELHRLWMLAAFHDPALRDPQQAFDGVQHLRQQAAGRLAAGGVPLEVQRLQQIQVVDLQAAIFASLGRFREAIDTSSEAIRLAREAKAPAEYIEQLSRRNQAYRDKIAYRFRYRVPVFGS